MLRTEASSGGESAVRIAAAEARQRALDKAERDRQRISEGIANASRATGGSGTRAAEGVEEESKGGGEGSAATQGATSERIRIRDLSTYDRLREALYSGTGAVLSAVVRVAMQQNNESLLVALIPNILEVSQLLFRRMTEEGDGNIKISIAEALSYIRGVLEDIEARKSTATALAAPLESLMVEVEDLVESAIAGVRRSRESL